MSMRQNQVDCIPMPTQTALLVVAQGEVNPISVGWWWRHTPHGSVQCYVSHYIQKISIRNFFHLSLSDHKNIKCKCIAVVEHWSAM